MTERLDKKIETLISTNSLAAWLNDNLVYDPESFTFRQPQTNSDHFTDNSNPVRDNLDDSDNLEDDFKFNSQNTSNLSDEEDQVFRYSSECISKSYKSSSRLSQPSISGIGLSEEVI